MNQELLRIVDSIARDKNIDKEELFMDIEAALLSAARKFAVSLRECTQPCGEASQVCAAYRQARECHWQPTAFQGDSQ